MGNAKSLSDIAIENNLDPKICFCCGNLLSHNSIACNFHQLCEDCEKKSYKIGLTACCVKTISPDILKKLKDICGICFKCDAVLRSKGYSVCKCKFCLNCVGELLSTEKRKCDECCEILDRIKFIKCTMCSKFNERKNFIDLFCRESICFDCIEEGFKTLSPDCEDLKICCLRCLREYDEEEIIQIVNLRSTNSH